MRWRPPLLLAVAACCVLPTWSQPVQILTPGQVTISHRKPVTATSTCGEINGQPIKEAFCSIAGSYQYSPFSQYSYQDSQDSSPNPNPFQEARNAREAFSLGGHGCGHCDASSHQDRHPAEYMVDGRENWWQSPPLSRGMQYNKVNITIDLEQEFHVAYVWIQMANSPKPSTWILERSTDYGKTFQPWFYFAENAAECMRRFGVETLSPITEDQSVICRTDFSSIQPLDNAEIVINLLENRPSRLSFATSEELQNFTRATNVRIRLLGARTLQGHLMDLNEKRDPSVTRRYFYAIKEVLMGGRCVCNGHASTCDILDPKRPRALLCRCEHNTCGDMCDKCCPGFEQKKWQPTTAHNNFTCEPCNCFGRSNECVYEEDLAQKGLSLDVNGNYEGGGRCLNCREHTTGINCNQCEVGFYRPEGVSWDALRPCKACECDPTKHTGACEEGTGRCECQARFEGEDCDRCAKGYYDAPECKKCECMVDGTVGEACLPTDEQCPCKEGYGGVFCETCSPGYTNVTAGCVGCECSDVGSEHKNCSAETGQCVCKSAYSGLACDQCQLGYFGFPDCTYCNCDPIGTEGGQCDSQTGQCLCKPGFVGERCDKCDVGFYGYPNCRSCECDGAGARTPECDSVSGQCPCFTNFTSRACDKCAAGFYDYPNCKACSCLIEGAKGQTCDNNGQCYCKGNFEGERCDRCKPNHYNFPACEECNCNPSGVTQDFAGCDKVAPGELCSCREHVTGRICDQCKPTFWDLQYHHPGGCVSCNCSLAGTISQTNSCDQKSGQCECKRNAGGRQCDECALGYYNLQPFNQQGCEPCNCDVGGSIRSECNGQTGQCRCRPRITGLRCDKPIENHYFPMLWHNQYEAEDGHTEDNKPVRFAVDQTQFPEYSWRGYAVFSPIQEKIFLDIDITKSSVYRLLFKFHNPTTVPITAQVTVDPRTNSIHDQEQTEKVTFAPTTDPSIKEVTVNGKPFVMNPGRWSLSVATKQRLFLDYVVVLPVEYYEATSLRVKGTPPCKAHTLKETICVDLLYPPMQESARVDLASGEFKNVNDDGTTSVLEPVPVEILPEIVGKAAFIRTDTEGRVIEAEFQVPEDNEYAMILEYHHLAEKNFPINVELFQDGESLLNGSAVVHHCPYATFCRELVTDRGIIPFVPFKAGTGSVQIRVPPQHEFGLAAIVLIKKSDWSNDYLQQVPNCVRKYGKCLSQEYPSAASAIVAEAESGPGQAHAINADKLPFEVSDPNNVFLVRLDAEKGTLDIPGVVPTRGHYKFLVHYYNPDNAPFDMSVLLQYHDQFAQAVVPLTYCPSVSGCRALIRDKEKPEIQQFFIEEKYTATFYFNDTQQGPIYIDSITAVPYSSFSEALMTPLPVDLSSDFATQCSDNFYHNHPLNATNFCKEKIFSLTSEFNSAAFPCECNARGSESFACEEYGGQCKCKNNVIGRKCERCAPGYYNFPECIKCKCGTSQQCDELTGQCFCPPHVEGTSCDRCVGYAFGFDPLIGCQPCGCHPQGSDGGAQQCDAESGQCLCRESVGGRQCDRCLAGFYGFPSCYSCRCETSGTTDAICDATSAACQCKENVVGQRCDSCKSGTFDLSKENPLGCADCFCFGITEQCRSSFFPVQIGAVDMSAFTVTDPAGKVTLDNEETYYESAEDSSASVYFNAPINHGADYTSSYGLTLSFKLSVSPKEDSRKMSTEADVRLHGGNNLTAEFWATEQPSDPEETFAVRVKLVPENFLAPSGKSFTREDLMMLLHSLKNITIKASYFESPQSARLVEFGLETSSPSGDSVIKASSVEQCNCPAPYQGPSCQQCAPGYYRVAGGSYLGSCVPCDCNGHSGSCDPDTGICFDCEDNTHGEHCEFCDEGHYGNATTGSPYSCMPCACPYTEAGNNFATSCETSEYGEVLSCKCKPGYTGERCERCDAGHFGEPTRPGGNCQQCSCNGNNNLTDPRSCHPHTGDCYLCENNTNGRHCEWCDNWFYGDAVEAKNCTSCTCDQCGSSRCDNQSGNCECKPDVVGEDCDRCAPDHWGFSRCNGCHACHCAVAASSGQCHGETGQCACRPGAAGLRCEHCEQGYWNYGEHGCTKCDCEADLSMGTVCDVRTGQCHCQEGATGARCDQCERSYLRIPTLGCRRCDECVFHLIADLNALDVSVNAVNRSMSNISSATLVGARISRNRKMLTEISELSQLLTNTDSEYNNLIGDAKGAVIERTNQLATANRSITFAIRDVDRVHNLTENATAIVQKIRDTAEYARFIVDSVRRLTESIGSTSTALEIDPRFLEEAQKILMDLESTTAMDKPEKIETTKATLAKLEEKIKEQKAKLDSQKERLESTRKQDSDFADTLASAQQYLKKTKLMSEDVSRRSRDQTLFKLNGLSKAIQSDLDKVAEERELVKNALLEANNKTEMAKDAAESISTLIDSVEEARDTLNKAAENKRVRREAGVDRVALKIRVDELKQEADRLNGTFGSTRLESESAVEAASAYENLTNSLINARNTATETTDLAKGQKDSLTEMKVQVETALSESQRLKEEAGRLKTEAEDLSKKAQEKEREVDSLADQVDTMRKTRNQLHESLKSPLTSSSDSIQEKTDQVHTMSADIQAALEENKEKLEKTKADAETAFSARAGATQDVKTTRSNIKDLGVLKPKLLAAFEAMKTAASERKTKMDGMKDKMAQVKEMIAVARDAANRIRLGAHFERGSSLDLNIPHRVSRSAAHTDISFYFRTGVEHGIPLFFGNEEGSAGTRAVPTDDYIAVEVEYGKPKVTIDLGDEPLVVSLDTKVSDMLWRRIDVRRIGKSATVSLTKAGSDEVGEKKQSVSDGNKSVLNLHQTISKLFVGGIPRNSRIAREIRNRDFEGDIEELLLHGEPVGLWNTRSKGMTNVQGSPKRPRNTDNVENLGVSLNGEGYIVHELGHWNPRKRTVLSLQFLTYSPDGLLFFVGKEREFMTLELSDGAVKLSVDFGSGVGSWQSDRNNLNDGEWHTVSVIRDGIHVKLGVDAETVADDNAPEGNAELSVSQNFYLGGVPTSVHLRTTVEPLRGCLRSIRLNSDDVDLQGRGVRASKGVRNSCPLGTVSTVSILSDRASAIFNNISTNGEAEVTLRFKTTMNSTATLFTVKTEEDDLLSLSFEDGTMTAASGDDKLTLEVSDINDEMWHFVSVKKNKQYLRIDVDDLHSKQTDRNNGEDAKPGETVQILFGKQGSGKFVGCVGDVTFNGQLLDFSKAIVNEVSLTGCSLRDDVIRTTVAPTTMSTDEVTTSTDGPKTIAEPGEETSSPTLTPAGLAQTTTGPVVTLAPIPRPEGSCALPKTPRGGFSDSDGTRFGAAANSHLEYLEIPDAFDKKGTFSLQVRATAASGVIFLATNEKQTDHVALFIMDGKLVFSYDAGAGQVLVKSSRSILDGQWHSVRATRNMEEAHLVVDDDSTDVTSVKGNSPIDTDAPLYVGGVPADLTAYVKTLLNVKSEFGGCIRDLKLNEKRFDQEPKEFNTVPCQAFYEHGIFFGPDGGHVILKKEYHIGQTFAADLEIRPRTDNAILLSVGKVEYLTVQIINGSIKFIVDSGAGADVMVYTPPENNGLCDGHWHSIKIMKKKNLMTLTVDGKSNLQIMKKNKKPDTVTNDPIYLGGVPEGVTNQGLATKENYVGCVRIVNYGDKKSRVIRRKKQLDIASMETFGDVNKEECPVN